MSSTLLIALAALAGTAAELPAPAVKLEGDRGSSIALLRCLAKERVTLTSGHRGGIAPGYPENAIETFARTLSQAPMLVEVDVRATRDGALVLMHDATLERTTTGTGKVTDRTLAEIKALRLVDPEGKETAFRVPTLQEAIAAARGRGILAIDLKEDPTLPGIARAIAEAGAHAWTLVNLYRPSQAMILHGIDREITIQVPISTTEDLEVLRRIGVNLDRVTAWTGIEAIDERVPALWAEMDRISMPAMHATLYTADKKVAEGDTSIYRELAAEGVDVIPTDHHLKAYEALSQGRDIPGAFARCATARD